VDEGLDVRAKGQDQRGRKAGEDEHPVREDEPVSEIDELARNEPVPGEQRCESREALIRRIRCEDENRERERL